jgi:hypothetical protein
VSFLGILFGAWLALNAALFVALYLRRPNPKLRAKLLGPRLPVPFATIIGVWNWGSGGQMEDSSAVFKRVL